MGWEMVFGFGLCCVPSTAHGHPTKHPKVLSQPAWDEPSGCSLSGGFFGGCGEHMVARE